MVPATGQVTYAGPNETYTYREFTGRLDYDLRSKQRLTVRNFLEFVNEPQGTINGNVLANVLGYSGHFYNELITHTWTISPTSVNVLSGGYLENDLLLGRAGKRQERERGVSVAVHCSVGPSGNLLSRGWCVGEQRLRPALLLTQP